MNTPLAYSIPEACKAASVSRAKLYQEWKEGRGPLRRQLGRKRLILAEDLEAWLRSLA